MFDIVEPQFLTLTLAQQGAAPAAPGEGVPLITESGANGEGTAPVGLFGPNFILFLFLMIVLLFVISIMSQRKEKKKREAMISAVKKHDKVQTIGGVIGSIVELKPDFVVLKVDESSNTRITFARSAIQQVIKSSDHSIPDLDKSS